MLLRFCQMECAVSHAWLFRLIVNWVAGDKLIKTMTMIRRHSAPICDGQAGRIPARVSALLASLLLGLPAFGSEFEIFVVDKDGQHVADVAVYATRLDGRIDLPTKAATATMDQVNKQFVPHLLIIPTGTAVDFPNSDTVAHHVYSFSHPNKFVLPMYKGEQHPPVTFDHGGVVSLGCNIHDNMLGYILVVDTTSFAMTDENGYASLSLENPQEYSISIWSPRIRDEAKLLTKTSQDPGSGVTFSLSKKLNPPHRGHSDGSSWSDY